MNKHLTKNVNKWIANRLWSSFIKIKKKINTGGTKYRNGKLMGKFVIVLIHIK